MFNYIFSKDFKYSDRNNMKIMGNVSDTDIIIDIGCGFNPDVNQVSVSNAIGIDRNFEKGKIMTDFPILSDAQHLPIRKGCIDFINCQAILEHIPNPELCLKDMGYIAKDKCKGVILIPIDSRQIYQTLIRTIKEFPFSLRRTFWNLIKSVTLWKVEGMLHITQINLSDIRRYFKIDKVGIKRHNHFYFNIYGLFWWLKKFKIINVRPVKVNEYAEWYIWFSK